MSVVGKGLLTYDQKSILSVLFPSLIRDSSLTAHLASEGRDPDVTKRPHLQLSAFSSARCAGTWQVPQRT